VGLTTLPQSVSRLSRQCGICNISQPYRPPRPVKGIAFLLFLYPQYKRPLSTLDLGEQNSSTSTAEDVTGPQFRELSVSIVEVQVFNVQI
jgi:hypothetical protein